MVKVYLKYKVNNDFNPKGWSTASAPYLIFKHVEKHVVKTEEEADIIIYNNNLLSREDIEKMDYHKSKKNIVIYINDDDKPIVVPNNVLLYRVSQNRRSKRKNEHAFPWATPILFKDDQYSTKNKGFDPIYNELSIGFCGAVGNQCSGYKIRNESVNYFKKSDIKTNFLLRKHFIRRFNNNVQKQFREIDFTEVIRNNIFQLAPRGAGNFSLRFFETMAYGRIPVLPLSDNVLPFEDKIDWENVIIMANTFEELESKMKEWYNKGEIFIKEKQVKCKKVWDEYLSMEGFCNQILKDG